ncbi:MAG TPA: lipopolysaccharide biosynthesis protein, partial [Pirellulaceae bacterium]|nr:lipopolysaccharide biosynthesis protein [Pirellulaceae bacterium]
SSASLPVAGSGASGLTFPSKAWERGAAAARYICRLASSPLLQKSALSVFDQAVVSGTSFVTAVILARQCPREELGVYYLALSLIFFVRGIQEQIVCAPYMIYCSRKQGTALAEYAGSSLIHQCVVMSAASTILAGALLLGFAPAVTQAAFWLLVGAGPLLLLREYIRQMSFAHLEMRTAITVDVAVSVLQLVAMGGLVLTGHLGVVETLATMGISSGVPAIVWLLAKSRPMLPRLDAALRDFLSNWTFARWALASQLLACTTPYVMPWVVALTHGEADTGTLGACVTLVGLANMFMMGLCNFLSPRAARAFAEGGLAELKSVLAKTALLFGLSLGSIAVAGFLVGEPVAMLVYGPQFAGTGWIIGVLSLSVLANSMGVTAGNGLWAMERPQANFVADLTSLGVVIVATISLVPLFGPLGAALATLSGTTTDAAVRLLILRLTMRELAAGRTP